MPIRPPGAPGGLIGTDSRTADYWVGFTFTNTAGTGLLLRDPHA